MDAFYDFVIDIEIRRFGIQQLDRWNNICSVGSKEKCEGAVAHGGRIIPLKDLRVLTGMNLPTQLEVARLEELSLLENALSKVPLNSQIGTSDTNVTIFKSVGIALEDVVVSCAAYEFAISQVVGQGITL